MKSTASPKIRIFLSRRDGEDNAYHTINDVCRKYQGVVLEDFRFNLPRNFQKKTLEECALEDDILVFLITNGEPSDRQSLDDPRLKNFLQRGGKVWVFYKMFEPRTADYQNGKAGSDRWYYERTDPKMHPNDDYVVSDYFGVDEKGYNQSLYFQFDRLLSTYVSSNCGNTRSRKWLWALITILVLFLVFMIGRPNINRIFHPGDSPIPVPGSTVVGSSDEKDSIYINPEPADENVSRGSATPRIKKSSDIKFSDAYKLEHKLIYVKYNAKDLSSRPINKDGQITPEFNIADNASKALWMVTIDASARKHPAGNSSGYYYAYVDVNVTICNTVSGKTLFQGDIITPGSKTSGIKGGSVNSFDDAVDKAYFEANKIIVELIKQKINE